MAGDKTLNYGRYMEKAMRGVMAEVLGHVARHGLPGEHYFYITFATGHPGIDIPDWLRERYPNEMTIVLQEWFEDLAVMGDRFRVTLNFSDAPETLVIPFEAVKTFIDPSVKFGLKFDDHEGDEMVLELDDVEEEERAEPEKPEGERSKEWEGDKPHPSADVVSLDRFRKS